MLSMPHLRLRQIRPLLELILELRLSMLLLRLRQIRELKPSYSSLDWKM
jgi:hypothetical protein